MEKKVYALVDCNNFFVSCERVFRPDLVGEPVVVLSNNDGCAIARSNEAKVLGIKMGEPYFKFKHLVKNNGIHVFSSNFTLYGDLSARVMQTINEQCPHMEVYSIDEAFLDLGSLSHEEILPFCKNLRETVYKWTGIPVSIGIAPTKTLCKVANHIAKRNPPLNGVLSFIANLSVDSFLSRTPVGEVWGIGRQHNKWLISQGIETALHLKNTPLPYIRKKMGVMGARIVDELQGTRCYELDEHTSHKKSISVTRTFRSPIEEFGELASAIAAFIERAGEKLRKESLLCKNVCVFVKTNRFDRESYYSNNHSLELERASDGTPDLMKTSMRALKVIYTPGLKYKKAGVILSGLYTEGELEADLFQTLEPDKLMAHIDSLNHKYGKQTLSYGRVSQSKVCSNARSMVSPQRTTSWEELFCLNE